MNTLQKSIFLRFRYLFSILLFLAVWTNNFATEGIADNGKVVAHKILILLNKGEIKKAKSKLDQALLEYPNSTSLLYQMARYHLKSEGGITADKSIIGFRYSNLSENGAVFTLKKLLEINPNYGEAYSLLGHIYAVQNNPVEAEEQFNKAEQMSIQPVWLNYNKALLAIQNNELSKAVKLLQLHTSRAIKLPQSKAMRDAMAGLYSASWSTLKRLVIKHPKYDPVKSIREGLVKRVNIDDFKEYIASLKNTDKEVYVHFSSSDEWCAPCLTDNKRIEKLAKEHSDKYEYIHVSFEPWSDIDYYTEITNPILLSKLPSQVVYKQSSPVLYKAGSICDCTFTQMIDGTFEKIKPLENMTKPNKNDASASIEYYYKNYVATEKSYKAYAVAVEENEWQTGFSKKRLTQENANRMALEQCETQRKKTNIITTSCKLYAIGDTKVFGFLQGEIDQITTSYEQKKLSPLDKIIKTYKSQKKVKALAFAVDKFHHWNSFYNSDSENICSNLEACKKVAVDECNRYRTKWKTTTPCELYFENNIQVKEIKMPTFL